MKIENINLQFAKNSNYIFTFDKFPDISFYVTSIQMPDVILGVIENPSPFVPIKTAGDSLAFGDLFITFMVDEDYTNYRSLLGWIFQLKELNSVENYNVLINASRVINTDKYCNGTLSLLDAKKDPILNIQYMGVFPNTLSGLTLSSNGEEEYHTCDLTLSFTDFSFI